MILVTCLVGMIIQKAEGLLYSGGRESGYLEPECLEPECLEPECLEPGYLEPGGGGGQGVS